MSLSPLSTEHTLGPGPARTIREIKAKALVAGRDREYRGGALAFKYEYGVVPLGGPPQQADAVRSRRGDPARSRLAWRARMRATLPTDPKPYAGHGEYARGDMRRDAV